MLTLIAVAAAVVLNADPVVDQMVRPQPAADTSYEAKIAAIDAEEEAAEKALRKECGKDYHRVRVGMRFNAKLQKCSGVDWYLKYEDTVAKVYDSDGGAVRVEGGKITRVKRR